MIVVTFKGEKSPLIGRVKGWGVVSDTRAPIVSSAIESAMKRFANEQEGFMFVASGAQIHTARVYQILDDTWDVAVHINRIGRTPEEPQPFDGIGHLSLDTVLFKRTLAACRVLDRWSERNVVTPNRESINLAITLAEMRDVNVLHLHAAWVWREEMRAQFPNTDPVVQFRSRSSSTAEAPQTIATLTSAPVTPKPIEEKQRPPECMMFGYFSQYTGYAKACREVLFRLANSLNVHLNDNHREPISVAHDLQVRLEAHKKVLVSPKAPALMLKGPDIVPGQSSHKIIWTMQESSVRIHPHMVKQVNEIFDEIWIPTKAGLDVFLASGVEVPGRVMPLGVNPLVYRPMKTKALPLCRLISTKRRGLIASPKGFTFLTVGLLGFRKGWDVVADAFELAFSGKRDVNLIIAVTHSPSDWNNTVYKQFSKYKVPIWTLEGSKDEHELARIYSSVGAYVSASRGEGFNLPAAEAAACGLPVIVPENTCHPELFGPHAFFFSGEGEKTYPEGDWISDWYKGQLFTNFGRKSIRALADLMIYIKRGGRDVRSRADALREKVVTTYTWDAAAALAAARLMEVQP